MAKAKTKNLTVIIRKAVDGYHIVGSALDVPDDKYHRGLVKLGALEIVPEDKPAHREKAPPELAGATEPVPEAIEAPTPAPADSEQEEG